MAKKREAQPVVPESEDSDEQLSSDSESEPESEPKVSPSKPSTQIPDSTNSSDDSLSGSDSESDDDESDPEPEPQPEPVAKKAKSSGEVIGKGSDVGVKRGAEKVVESKDVKKAKKVETLGKKDGKSEEGLKNNGKSEDSVKKIDSLVKRDGKSERGSKKIDNLVKKDGKDEGRSEGVSRRLFQRIFSEDDEIVLLKGMLDFIAKEKGDPFVEIDEFLDFVKKLLHLDVTKQQLFGKMRRLKATYVSKVKEGQETKFLKQHGRDVYELSSMIWGNVDVENNNNVDGGLENGKENGSVMKKCKNADSIVSAKVEDKPMLAVKGVNGDGKFNGVDIGSSGLRDGVGHGYAALEQRIMSEEIENIGSEKKRELEKKLTKIEVAELDLCVMRWDYMAEKARLIIAAKKAEL